MSLSLILVIAALILVAVDVIRPMRFLLHAAVVCLAVSLLV